MAGKTKAILLIDIYPVLLTIRLLDITVCSNAVYFYAPFIILATHKDASKCKWRLEKSRFIVQFNNALTISAKDTRGGSTVTLIAFCPLAGTEVIVQQTTAPRLFKDCYPAAPAKVTQRYPLAWLRPQRLQRRLITNKPPKEITSKQYVTILMVETL